VLYIIYGTIVNINYPPMAQLWQNIAEAIPRIVLGLVQFASSQLLLTAIFGILLFVAQRNLFGKSA
jgi:hypothetical protein